MKPDEVGVMGVKGLDKEDFGGMGGGGGERWFRGETAGGGELGVEGPKPLLIKLKSSECADDIWWRKRELTSLQAIN